jgi:hypothetical protein
MPFERDISRPSNNISQYLSSFIKLYQALSRFIKVSPLVETEMTKKLNF